MNLTLLGPVAAPVAGALLAAVLPRRVAAWTSLLAAVGVLAGGLALAARTGPGATLADGLLRADALTAWLVVAVGAVATVACWAGVHHLADLAHRGDLTAGAARRYLVLVQAFLACMTVAVMAANVGLFWVAVEATTIVTAFLVGHQRTRASVEAAWKYVVLCSIGVGIALLGTICVYAAAIAAGPTPAGGLEALNWSYLNRHAAQLDPGLMRLAAGLILLGFGAKAGLVPMHAWLPDAHSQAPAPVSALMSGVLLSVAFYGILRYKSIIDAALGPAYVRTLLLVAGLGSLALAALLLVGQRDYKRLLAYSSIEHMGLIALGTAIGGRLALAAVLLHILGHGLAKAVAFCGAGHLLHQVGSPLITAVRGALTRTPATAGLFGLAVVALLGLPPFALFASEITLARAGFAAGLGAVVTAAFLLVLVAFAAIARHAAGMLLGSAATPSVSPASPPDPASPVPAADPVPPRPPAAAPAPRLGLRWLPLALGLLTAAGLGIWLGPLQPLLDSAALVAAEGIR
jgi:hydrogenase-4 component F